MIIVLFNLFMIFLRAFSSVGIIMLIYTVATALKNKKLTFSLNSLATSDFFVLSFWATSISSWFYWS